MASDELFLTLKPDPVADIHIDPVKYDAVRGAILHNLREYGPMTFTQLGALVDEELRTTFSGSVTWYYTAVKLDMESRGEIRRMPNSRPQVIELA